MIFQLDIEKPNHNYWTTTTSSLVKKWMIYHLLDDLLVIMKYQSCEFPEFQWLGARILYLFFLGEYPDS